MKRFVFTPESKLLYDHETGKEYLFHDECYISWDDTADCFRYDNHELGPWSVTGKTVELIHACDKNHYLLKLLIQKNVVTNDVFEGLYDFTSVLRSCLYYPSMNTDERNNLSLVLVNEFNLELEHFLTDQSYNLAKLLLTAFRIGEMYRRDILIYRKKVKDSLKLVNNEEITSWVKAVFEHMPEDYTGGPCGPFTAAYDNMQAKGLNGVAFTTFFNRVKEAMPLFLKDMLRREYCTFHNLPDQDPSTGDLIVHEVPDAELCSMVTELQNRSPKSVIVRRLLRWIKNYEDLIFSN